MTDPNDIDDTQRDFLLTEFLLREQERYEVARHDVNVFATMFRDESGHNLVQAPFHRDLQDFFSEVQSGILMAPPEHGKSIQLAIRALWEFGRNPAIRIALISSTIELGKKLLDMMKNNIEHNEDLHRVFPHLTKSNFSIWDKERIQIRGYRGTKKDYSIEVAGVGKHIYGSRFDLVILDDVMDVSNSDPPGPEKIRKWHETTLISRLTRGDREWIIGTPWNDRDFYHIMENEHGFPCRKFLVEDSESMDGTGAFLWSAQWDYERLMDRKRKMTSWRYFQQYYMRDGDPGTSPFESDKLKGCRGPADQFRNVNTIPAGFQCITGVDLGVRKKRKSDRTAYITIATDGTKKLLVDIRAGKWGLMEKKSIAEALHRMYGGFFVVEDNAAQAYMVELLEDATRVPVVPSTTNRMSKVSDEMGIPTMAIDINNGRWQFPALPHPPPEVQELFDEMHVYNPQAHTGDLLMALYLANLGVDIVCGGATVEVRGLR